MCTGISRTAPVAGEAKGADGWFHVTTATVGFDHGAHGSEEHALLLDFANYGLGTHARVAVELDIESGRALLEQLRSTIEEAEATGLAG